MASRPSSAIVRACGEPTDLRGRLERLGLDHHQAHIVGHHIMELARDPEAFFGAACSWRRARAPAVPRARAAAQDARRVAW